MSKAGAKHCTEMGSRQSEPTSTLDELLHSQTPPTQTCSGPQTSQFDPQVPAGQTHPAWQTNGSSQGGSGFWGAEMVPRLRGSDGGVQLQPRTHVLEVVMLHKPHASVAHMKNGSGVALFSTPQQEKASAQLGQSRSLQRHWPF